MAFAFEFIGNSHQTLQGIYGQGIYGQLNGGIYPGSIVQTQNTSNQAYVQFLQAMQTDNYEPKKKPRVQKVGGRMIDHLRRELKEWHGNPFA